jgi:hypothetical protein
MEAFHQPGQGTTKKSNLDGDVRSAPKAVDSTGLKQRYGVKKKPLPLYRILGYEFAVSREGTNR